MLPDWWEAKNMLDPNDLDRKSKTLERLFAAKLGLRRGPLDTRLRRARRMLPRPVRRDIATVVDAHRNASHPKLARQIPFEQVDTAYARAEAHLTSLSAWDRRWGATLGVLASIAASLLGVAVLLVIFLHWRGLI